MSSAGLAPSASPTEAKPAFAEPPELAPGVTLCGRMTDSAFVDPPWLVDRGGRYLHVSELLYRVAEQVDGRRDVEAVAAAVSGAGRELSAEHAADVLRQLRELRIVSPAAGEAAMTEGAAEVPPSGSVRLKRVLIGPEAALPVLDILKHLFRTPIVALGLAAALVAELWLSRVHGMTTGLSEALRRPELVLGALAIVIVGTLFHELGHAAALRYGGGKPGEIGMGVFLVYPVFYTDVTDNYRLPRLDRVRTDLGGIYFTLLFIAALVAVHAVTGAAVLLLAVLLLNLQTVYNLIPFVRFDGYWAASDITGVPDFFTYAGPFVRSYLPGRLAGQGAMPDLKPWARAFFAAWLLVTVPLLVKLIAHVVARFPDAVEAAAAAVRHQAATLSAASSAGDQPLLLVTLLRIAALALPVTAMAYIVFRLARWAILSLGRWSRPTPLRRAMGSLVGAAALLALLSLWAPELPMTDGRPGPLYRRLRAGLAGAAPASTPTPTPEVPAGPMDGPRPVP